MTASERALWIAVYARLFDDPNLGTTGAVGMAHAAVESSRSMVQIEKTTVASTPAGDMLLAAFRDD